MTLSYKNCVIFRTENSQFVRKTANQTRTALCRTRMALTSELAPFNPDRSLKFVQSSKVYLLVYLIDVRFRALPNIVQVATTGAKETNGHSWKLTAAKFRRFASLL